VESASPRSQLTFVSVPAEQHPVRATVIPLQGQDSRLEDLVAAGRSLGGDVELFVPEAPRAVYFGRAMVSRYWFVAEPDQPGVPDPPSFGDTLYQVEQFVYDVLDRPEVEGRLPCLLGVEQGAVLALAATEVIPQQLAGVIAVGGFLAEIPGWEPPERELNGLPVLLLNEPGGGRLPPGLIDETRERLVREGAAVETVTVEDALALGPEVQDVLAIWLRARSS